MNKVTMVTLGNGGNGHPLLFTLIVKGKNNKGINNKSVPLPPLPPLPLGTTVTIGMLSMVVCALSILSNNLAGDSR